MTLVQTARARLPELDALVSKAESRPERGTRHFLSGELLREFGHSVLEIRCVIDRLALNRSPCADLALARTRGEVRVCFRVRYLLDRAFGAHLDFKRRPVKADRGDGVRSQLASLATLEVGVEDEASLIHVLHQHDSH